LSLPNLTQMSWVPLISEARLKELTDRGKTNFLGNFETIDSLLKPEKRIVNIQEFILII